MENKYTEEDLNQVDKELLVRMILELQERLDGMTAEQHAMNENLQLMLDQIIMANKNC